MTTPQPPIVKWNDPNAVPEVKLGAEKLYWIAVKNPMGVHVFTAHYQNRPITTDESGNPIGDCEAWALTSPDGDYVHSVGWMDCKSHSEFDDYYEGLEFNNDYKLLGWAEFQAPAYPMEHEPVGSQEFDDLVSGAISEAQRAMAKFPQPNYVLLKVAEEAGEVVKEGVHCSEGRGDYVNLRNEITQVIAMLYRLHEEGDQTIGLAPIKAKSTGAAA